MGWPWRPDALPQEAWPPAATSSAALPYLSLTICLMSPSLMAASSRRAARGAATVAALGQLEPQRLPGCRSFVLEVVVEVIDLPLDAVRILDPELVLIGVAAVDSHLLADRQSGRLHAGEVFHHGRHRVDLDADVVHRALRGGPAFGEGQVHGRPLGQELQVARLHLDGPRTEEALVEVAALAEIPHVHVQVDFGAHSDLLLAAGGEQSSQGGRRLPLHGVVDVPLFLSALHESGAPERVQVVREGGAGDLHRGLDLADRDFSPGAHEVEEHLEAGEMAESLESLDVGFVGLQLGQGQASDGFHISNTMKLSNCCQASAWGRRRGQPRSTQRSASPRSRNTSKALMRSPRRSPYILAMPKPKSLRTTTALREAGSRIVGRAARVRTPSVVKPS